MSEFLHSSVSPRLGRRQALLAAVVGMLVLLVFFRQQVLSGFAVVAGDRYDAVIEVSLLEHWFNVFKGHAHWAMPNYFYPYSKVISHNDGYFLYGALYSLFRALSLDPFLAGELVNLSVKAVGFAGFLVAAMRLCRLSFGWALAGAVLFTLGNASYVRIEHAQLLSAALLPVQALLLHGAYAALLARQRKPLLAYGIASGVFFGAWLMTSVYMAWFFVLFLAIVAVSALVIGPRQQWRDLLGAVLAQPAAVLIVAAVALVSVYPFVWAYMLGDHGPRSWEEVSIYLPSLADSINVGDNNLLFGRLLQSAREVCPACDLGRGEREVGFAPLLFGLFLIACVYALRKSQAPLLVRALALSTLVAWLLAVQVGGVTAWRWVYAVWPGATGLRAVARLWLFLAAPVVVLAMWLLAQHRRRIGTAALVVCVSLLVIEELNMKSTAQLYREQQLMRVQPAMPPAGCRAFVATDSPDTDHGQNAPFQAASLTHNIDAMLAAELVNLPTINGHASFAPPDWNFANPVAADYLTRVSDYARRHGLQGLCRLDLVSMQWSQALDAPRTVHPLLRVDFADSQSSAQTKLTGFDAPEAFGRWSLGQRATITFMIPQGAPARMVRLAFATALANGQHSQRMQLRINGGASHELVFAGSGRRVIDLPLRAGPSQQVDLTMALPSAVTPAALGINNDHRQLAVAIQSLELF